MSEKNKLVDIASAREKKESKLKREYERVLFDRILGCYTVIENKGIKSIEIVDISKNGVSFHMEENENSFRNGDLLKLRFYFTQKTYLPCSVEVVRAVKDDKNGAALWTYGCKFDQGVKSYEALHKFVDFIEFYAKNAKEDQGEKIILYF